MASLFLGAFVFAFLCSARVVAHQGLGDEVWEDDVVNVDARDYDGDISFVDLNIEKDDNDAGIELGEEYQGVDDNSIFGGLVDHNVDFDENGDGSTDHKDHAEENEEEEEGKEDEEKVEEKDDDEGTDASRDHEAEDSYQTEELDDEAVFGLKEDESDNAIFHDDDRDVGEDEYDMDEDESESNNEDRCDDIEDEPREEDSSMVEISVGSEETALEFGDKHDKTQPGSHGGADNGVNNVGYMHKGCSSEIDAKDKATSGIAASAQVQSKTPLPCVPNNFYMDLSPRRRAWTSKDLSRRRDWLGAHLVSGSSRLAAEGRRRLGVGTFRRQWGGMLGHPSYVRPQQAMPFENKAPSIPPGVSKCLHAAASAAAERPCASVAEVPSSITPPAPATTGVR